MLRAPACTVRLCYCPYSLRPLPFGPLPPSTWHNRAVHVRVPRGRQVSGLSPGDWVVPMAPALGTWRTRGVYDASQWHRVPKEIGLAAAATIVIKYVPTHLCPAARACTGVAYRC